MYIFHKIVAFFERYVILYILLTLGAVRMYKQCRTEQSSQRQRQLEQGLLEAMYHKHYEEISVSDLCDQMQIPRKSFYRYFSSKDGALHALLDHTLLDSDNFVMTETGVEKQNALVFMERIFAYWKHCKPLMDALERSNLSGVLIQRAIEHSQREMGLPRFLSSDEHDARKYGSLFAICGLMTMIVQWHHEGFAQSVEQMARIAMRLLSEPLFPDMEE